MSLRPEHQKVKAIQAHSQQIHEFVHWLNDKGIILAQETNDSEAEETYYPVYTKLTDLVAEFFEIDLNQLEKEKLDMIEEMREHNSRKT